MNRFDQHIWLDTHRLCSIVRDCDFKQHLQEDSARIHPFLGMIPIYNGETNYGILIRVSDPHLRAWTPISPFLLLPT